MGFRSLRLVDVLEAAYTGLERSPEAWLRGVLESVRVGFDQGLGVQGYFIDASSPDRFDTSGWQAVGIGDVDAGREAFRRWNSEVPADFKRRVHSFAPFGTGSALPPDIAGEDATRSSQAHGYPEMIGVNGIDATLRGCAIAAASDTPIAMPDPRITRQWSRVAVHLATAARLRRRLATSTLRRSAEAVLDSGGKLLEASGAARDAGAREALRDGARAIDRARSNSHRDDSESTLELWQALVAGRWSLVDDFEEGGRRYLLAVPNRTALPARGVLTRREREVLGALALGHPNKMIAYALGLAPSTVASHIARAAEKLGSRNRLELVRLIATTPGLIDGSDSG